MDAALVIIAAHEDEVAPLVIAALRSTSRRLYLYFAGKNPSAMLGIAPSLQFGKQAVLFREASKCIFCKSITVALRRTILSSDLL